VDLIRIKDAHLTYPPTFRRHRDGYDSDDTGLGDGDELSGDEYDDDAQERSTGEGGLTPTVALRGVSLKVKDGEGLALLGRPGCGRSSVLSLMSGVLRPDDGTVQVRGWAGGLPAAGAGFLRYMSVGDNIVRNLVLLGESRARAKSMVPEIAEWIGLEDRTDLRLAKLSRPIIRQLGYAVAFHCEPTVFLADEDISTLPKPVKERGFKRMLEFRESGRALVVASNRREMLRRLCTRGVVLDEGRVVAEGDIEDMLRVLKGVPMREAENEEGSADEPTDD
jgi:ABC-2 type transport system ATP-binding protein